jgi:hypothetical protein
VHGFLALFIFEKFQNHIKINIRVAIKTIFWRVIIYFYRKWKVQEIRALFKMTKIPFSVQKYNTCNYKKSISCILIFSWKKMKSARNPCTFQNAKNSFFYLNCITCNQKKYFQEIWKMTKKMEKKNFFVKKSEKKSLFF